MQLVSPQLAEAQPVISLPMQRETYFIGETVPFGVTSANGTAELIGEDGNIAATSPLPTGTTAWRLDTTNLAPGIYSLKVRGAAGAESVSTPLILTSTLRPSPGTLFDESLPDPRTPSDVTHRTFEEAGIGALIALGQADGRQYSELDQYARHRAMLWTNLYTRPLSFVGARVVPAELEGMAHRMVEVAQLNAKYPNFGGIAYHWDPVGNDRSTLLIYWAWGEMREALMRNNARSLEAVNADFRRRTGLEPVSAAEFTRYALATGHPEFAAAFDLPTSHWISAIAAHSPPMPPAELAALEKRIDAWTLYLTSIMGETNAYYQKWMKQVEPTMTGTSSHDNEYSVRDGSWPPGAYAPLDFRWIEAWTDQVGAPDYVFQGLFNAALTDNGSRPGQPVWVGSALSEADKLAPYPGRFMRTTAQNMAYNGRGMGFALEAFSNVFSGMTENTRWPNLRGTAGAQDLIAGREWLRRFSALQEQTAPVRQVGVLLSLSQFGRQYSGLWFDTPAYNAFITLARLGYTPRFVTEADIDRGGLQGFRALVIENQTAPLSGGVLAALKTFRAGGGLVLVSKNSTASIPGRVTLDVAEPYKRPGRPHNWGTPNTADLDPTQIQEKRFDEMAPAFRSALGNSLRTPLLPDSNEQSRISTFALGGGVDATYVVATNDTYPGNQSTWARQTVSLRPNGANHYEALYDVTDEKSLGAFGPIRAGFMDRPARLYALLTRSVDSLDVRATQTVSLGESIDFSVAFRDKAGLPLRAALPFNVRLTRPDGTVAQQYYRATGRDGAFSMNLPTATNLAPGRWVLSVKNMLDGRVFSLPIQLSATHAAPVVLKPVDTPVVARGDFAALWKNTPSIVAPIFDGVGRQGVLNAALAAKRVLAAKGIEVEIVEHPVMSTYTLTYDPTPEQIAENERADKGETIGKINRVTVNQNDYFAVASGYEYGHPVLLFDKVGAGENPLVGGISNMLWPAVSAGFPGVGKATIQVLKSPFKLGENAVVVQSVDDAGLLAGANALAEPPADWISAGVAAARSELQQGMSIGRDPASAVRASATTRRRLTADGTSVTSAADPLKLDLGASPPPLRTATTAVVPMAPPICDVPGKLDVSKVALTYYQTDGKWVHVSTPGGDWIGDLRFSDATYLKVRVPRAGRYKVSMDGVFRYSDRRPGGQSTWDDAIDLYMKTVQPKRQPMSFEVNLDGKKSGALSDVRVGQSSVQTEWGVGIDTRVDEETGLSVQGVVTLPAGVHELLFIHHNIVDGHLKSITVEPTP